MRRTASEKTADGMVDIVTKSCSRGTCRRKAPFNVKGNGVAALCKQHAGAGMVHVACRCARDSSKKCPSFNVKGSKKPAFLHAIC